MRYTISLITLLTIDLAVVAAQPFAPLRLINSDTLPKVIIDGEPVKIHTQGLYVTNQDYIVTGRVDTPPRRPVVLRFCRDRSAQYETLSLKALAGPNGTLDHPGGFDRDADGVFWIPLSTSHSRGPTKLIGISLRDGKLPDDTSEIARMIDVPDHLGAVCCLPDRKLLAANWDTRNIYLIDSTSGELLEKFDHDDYLRDSGAIRLAVQDWKFDPAANRAIAGGLDKSRDRKPDQSQAVVAVVDPAARSVVEIHRLPSPDGAGKPVTNEGLAVHGGKLYLLPDDIGRGAEVLSYRFALPAEQSP